MKRDYLERKKLEQVIPINTPMLIFIEPTNICNFKCKFCPTGNKNLLEKINRPIGSMNLETFKKVADQIKQFPNKINKIHFYLNGEPLLNKDLCKMIKYAKDNEISEELWIKTNGYLLTPELSVELIESGLDFIGISIEGVSNKRYKEICGVDVNYNTIVKNVEYLYNNRKECKIYVKIADYGLTDEEKQKFYDDFKSISTEIKIENLMGWSMSSEKDFTLGTKPDKTVEGENIKVKNVCPYPFYTLAINFNGDVSLCCVDWSLSTVVGNLNQEKLIDIWNGKNLYNFRKMHLEFRKKENKACGDCYFIDCHPDNIDNYSAKILNNIENDYRKKCEIKRWNKSEFK